MTGIDKDKVFSVKCFEEHRFLIKTAPKPKSCMLQYRQRYCRIFIYLYQNNPENPDQGYIIIIDNP